jgi:hypothetical protein
MYVVGFAIHRGTVRAHTTESGKSIGLMESPIPAAEAGTGTATLSAAGVPLFFLDLRSVRGELADWLSSERLYRSCGALWDRSNPDQFLSGDAPRKSFDGLVYLENTHAAKGLQLP